MVLQRPLEFALYAIIYLLRQIQGHPEYVHILSGQDILIKSSDEFETFFSHNDQSYMTIAPLGKTDIAIRRRLEGYNLFPNADSRKLPFKIINRVIWHVQKLLHLERRTLGDFSHIYKGMIWTSLPYDAVQYVMQYINEHPLFLKQLRHTLLPEEFFFQTILMNSPYRKTIVPTNLRYTLWIEKHGSGPAILDEDDFNSIMQSEDYFARKIVSPYSDTLISKIDETLTLK